VPGLPDEAAFFFFTLHDEATGQHRRPPTSTWPPQAAA
jgi:hypothetical protein